MVRCKRPFGPGDHSPGSEPGHYVDKVEAMPEMRLGLAVAPGGRVSAALKEFTPDLKPPAFPKKFPRSADLRPR